MAKDARFNMSDKALFFRYWIEATDWDQFLKICWDTWSQDESNHKALDKADPNWRNWGADSIKKYMDRRVFTKATGIKKAMEKADPKCGIVLPKGGHIRYGKTKSNTTSTEDLLEMWRSARKD